MTLNDLYNLGIESLDFNTKLFIYDENMEKQPISKIILDKSSGELEIIFDYEPEF